MFLLRSLAFKIIGLFTLNILLLAGVILFAAKSQLSEELDSVIGKEISRGWMIYQKRIAIFLRFQITPKVIGSPPG